MAKNNENGTIVVTETGVLDSGNSNDEKSILYSSVTNSNSTNTENEIILNTGNENTEKIKPIIVISIPTKNEKPLMDVFDNKDHGAMHFIVADNIYIAKNKLYKYLDKFKTRSVKNIIFDTHGGGAGWIYLDNKDNKNEIEINYFGYKHMKLIILDINIFGELKCNKCKNKHSVTSGTLFHHLKFDIVKAFLMVFLVSTDKKGVSSLELHRRTGIRAKTCYYFKRKIMKAMHQGDFKLSGRVDVDESSVGGKEPGKRGRSKGKKKEFVIGVQMLKTKIVRAFAHQIKNASSKELRPFFEQRVSTKATVRVDKWRAYNPIKRNYPNMPITINTQTTFAN
jgi:hypothetical protein